MNDEVTNEQFKALYEAHFNSKIREALGDDTEIRIMLYGIYPYTAISVHDERGTLRTYFQDDFPRGKYSALGIVYLSDEEFIYHVAYDAICFPQNNTRQAIHTIGE